MFPGDSPSGHRCKEFSQCIREEVGGQDPGQPLEHLNLITTQPGCTREAAALSPPERKSISSTVLNYPGIAAGAAFPWDGWGRGTALSRLPPGIPRAPDEP